MLSTRSRYIPSIHMVHPSGFLHQFSIGQFLRDVSFTNEQLFTVNKISRNDPIFLSFDSLTLHPVCLIALEIAVIR